MKETFFNNKYGHAQFRIVTKDSSETHAEFDVYEITAWSADDKYTPVDEELYLSCTITWDHHSHFNFGELEPDGRHNGYLHLCGAESMTNHLKIMEYLYNYADEVMNRKEQYEELGVKVVTQNER